MIPTPTSGEISLYFHIPFCSRKCDYCHFFVLPDNPTNHSRLITGLKGEWKWRLEKIKNQLISSIYFGGGTPSLLYPDELYEILSWIPYESTAEVTLEANPEHLTYEKLKVFRECGINRLSIGAQSFDDQLLTHLSRTHNSRQTIEALELSSKAGFENISIDLMYDLPNQTLSHWDKTLKTAMELPITHLSLYNLTIEPETVFFKKQAKLKPTLPDPEASLAMYRLARERLPLAGLEPYEISAFAKEGYYSRHNSGYWTARPFLGFGPSAYSFWDNVRFRNVAHLEKYLKAIQFGTDPADLYDTLPDEARLRELLAVELRLKQGVHIPTFVKRHGKVEAGLDTAVASLIKRGWLELKADTLALTEQGILFYDSVATELI